MIFRPFYYDTGCAAHVFGCGREGIGAVVDPEKPADMAELMKITRGLA